ncbi:MAG TPA: COX15/CtaA family protein [Nitrososphaera sp.]|jgi:cytochrome c oxidase assembly protein subunit 15|nr:COX15/CtaA family protein [Nitrososphaera sp.]
MFILKPLSFTTLAVLFALIFIGGYVGASGVGLTCPEWPLCPRGLLPHEDFVIEYIHRSVAATTGMLVIATMAFTLKSKEAPRGMKIASMIAAGAVIGQITLGAIVIVERLHAVLVTAHLGLGLVLFSMVLIIVLSAFRIDNDNKRRMKTREASSKLSTQNNKTTTTRS